MLQPEPLIISKIIYVKCLAFSQKHHAHKRSNWKQKLDPQEMQGLRLSDSF